MAYEFRYRLNRAPGARGDGSGALDHDIEAVYAEDESPWIVVPGRHKTIVVPGDQMQAVLAMPDANGPEKMAKARAYKDVLRANLNTQPESRRGWSDEQMADFLDGNKLSEEVANGADDFLTVVLGLEYPFEFDV